VGKRNTGIPVSPWQIERWRQAGLLQHAELTYPGHGSVAACTEDARQQAIAVAHIARLYRSHADLARLLFARGLHVREDALRLSLESVIDRLDAWIGPAETDDRG
jgi:hypothetical protein